MGKITKLEIVDCFVVGSDPESRLNGKSWLARKIKAEYRGKVFTLSLQDAIALISKQGIEVRIPCMFLKDRCGRILSVAH